MRDKLIMLEEMLDEMQDEYYTSHDQINAKLNEAIAYLSDIIDEYGK